MSGPVASTVPAAVRGQLALTLPRDYDAAEPLIDGLVWLVLIVAVISLLVIAAKLVMASMRNHSMEAAEGVSQIPWVLLAICMTFLAVPLVTLLIPGTGINGIASAGDELSSTSQGTGHRPRNPDQLLPAFNFPTAISHIFAIGKGVVVVLAVLGILYSAGRMALGKFGRSDLVVRGVGGVTWVIFGLCLMLLSSVLISGMAGMGEALPIRRLPGLPR
jgi:hypothetical protein